MMVAWWARCFPMVVISAVAWGSWGPTASADDAAAARFHDDLAREHYRARRYEDAAREFILENRIAPNPRIVFNIALCFQQLGRDEDAFLYFSEYLDSGHTDERFRRQAQQAVDALGRRVARLRIGTDPPGAEIFVDQRDHGSYGRTPRVLALAHGSHRIVLERAGHRVFETEVEVERGREVELTAELRPIVGVVHVESQVPAAVAVRDPDGATVAEGVTPHTVSLPPGHYYVEVAAESHLVWTRHVTVEPERALQLLAAPARLPPPTGALTVTANAAGALVELDGQRVGLAPTVLSEVPAGRHHLRVAHAGLRPWSGDVTVAEGERLWLTATLGPPSVTERSEWTWLLGGFGVAALVGAGVTGVLAIATHAEFQSVAAGDEARRASLRDQGLVLNAVADGLALTGLLSLAGAAILYFVTEEVRDEPSQATTSRSSQ